MRVRWRNSQKSRRQIWANRRRNAFHTNWQIKTPTCLEKSLHERWLHINYAVCSFRFIIFLSAVLLREFMAWLIGLRRARGKSIYDVYLRVGWISRKGVENGFVLIVIKTGEHKNLSHFGEWKGAAATGRVVIKLQNWIYSAESSTHTTIAFKGATPAKTINLPVFYGHNLNVSKALLKSL